MDPTPVWVVQGGVMTPTTLSPEQDAALVSIYEGSWRNQVLTLGYKRQMMATLRFLGMLDVITLSP